MGLGNMAFKYFLEKGLEKWNVGWNTTSKPPLAQKAAKPPLAQRAAKPPLAQRAVYLGNVTQGMHMSMGGGPS